MSTTEPRKRLIEKIQATDDEGLPEDAYRFLENGFDDMEISKLNDVQIGTINEARMQIKNGQ